MALSGDLQDWREVRKTETWTGLLVGNGASCALWKKFAYQSLYKTARSSAIDAPLSEEHEAIFDELDTTNFELVLSTLLTSKLVCSLLRHRTSDVESLYAGIQEALAQAVHHVHVPWNLVPEENLQSVAAALRRYRWIYSTNYDLLLYWAIMAEEEDRRAKDFFWGSSSRFDLSDTRLFEDNRSAVLYLHGGLHLYRKANGETLKRTAAGGNLLDLFGTSFHGASPLLVSEGKSGEKLASIYRSDYLSFAYSRLENHDGPLVVFGHGLGRSDQHLVDAINQWESRVLAISIRPGSEDEVVARKIKLRQTFPNATLHYFDSSTHPLGKESLQIEDPAGY